MSRHLSLPLARHPVVIYEGPVTAGPVPAECWGSPADGFVAEKGGKKISKHLIQIIPDSDKCFETDRQKVIKDFGSLEKDGQESFSKRKGLDCSKQQ